MQKPHREHLSADMSVGVGIPFRVHHPLLFLGQGDPEHRQVVARSLKHDQADCLPVGNSPAADCPPALTSSPAGALGVQPGKSLARSLAPQVRVNCLAPGWVRTAWGEGASAAWQERVRRETPLQRWGTPEDVAAAARWLVSPAASYISGQTIRINGGAVRL